MNFLLEIGTEEIPHWMIPGALKQLSALDLLGATATVDATPRRLVVRASEVPERTPDQEQVIKGPPASAGEKAAAGFARKQGVELAALAKAGDYYELKRLVPGRRAVEIFSETLPAAIVGIQWPKTMYWTAKNGPRFIRPIRWMVALLDDQVIPFEIAGVRSGNVTRGHRQLGSSSVPVTIANYESELRRNFVILSSHERRHKIEKEASGLGAKIDADLLETLTFITEYPTAIRGEFDPAFLELPAEVLTTVMRHHQKYFSLEARPGVLAPNFVAVMNTSGDPEGLVKHGNERVLKARFNDARFFWNMDQAKKLADRVEDLKKVTFHVKLGSYFEKTERIERLVEFGGADVVRAARLCKCDLTTEMVKEFTELQGVVGGLYARAQQEPEPVWRAIYDHYKPEGMEDSIPTTREGQILSLADKLDTLRECFGIGMVPTGSKDPFGLRRAAQGIVRILAEGQIGVPLTRIHTLMAPEGLQGGDSKRIDLYPFFLERIKHYFREIRGFKYDEVDAIIDIWTGSLGHAESRLRMLSDARKGRREQFEAVAASFKRIKNILRQANFERPPDGFLATLDPEGLEQADRDLYAEYGRVNVLSRERDEQELFETFASIRPAVDNFFDKVMVLSEDPDTRLFRLTLLDALFTEFSAIADFTKIVTSGDQK